MGRPRKALPQNEILLDQINQERELEEQKRRHSKTIKEWTETRGNKILKFQQVENGSVYSTLVGHVKKRGTSKDTSEEVTVE